MSSYSKRPSGRQLDIEALRRLRKTFDVDAMLKSFVGGLAAITSVKRVRQAVAVLAENDAPWEAISHELRGKPLTDEEKAHPN